MKRLFTLLLISFAALSCEMVDDKLNDLLDKRDWVVFADGTELTVDVPSKQTVLNYKFESTLDWEVKTDAEWLEIDPMSGKAGKDIKIQIKVAKNKDKKGRTGYADLILSNNESYRITINQAGEGDENEDIVVEIPNNQIWYTSTDGEIVEPYSGEYNNNADAPTTFGVKIVSNTYKDGKGVIEFDGDVTMIGERAFYYCTSLTSIIIPDSVTLIGDYAFNACEGLGCATLGNSVEHIGFKAFDDCVKLTEITIPESVNSIGAQAFCYCINLSSFKGKFATEDGLCLIVDGTLNAIAIGRDNIGDYVIPSSVNIIEMYSIYYCHSMTSVTIPDSVTVIRDGAFKSCTSLKEVYCKPTTPPTGGYDMFYDNALGRKICVPAESYYDYISAECWRDYADSIVGEGDIVAGDIPNNEIWYTSTDGEIIEPYSDEHNNYADALTTFGANIVSNTYVDGKGVIEFDEDVTKIGRAAFLWCPSLRSVTIPGSVTTIGEMAFQKCESLTSVNIPDSVTEIGYYVFTFCTSLTSFNGKFASEDNRCLIVNGELVAFAPAGLTEYTIPDSVTTTGEGAFYDCNLLTSVTIPGSVTMIGHSAFYHCDSLTSVTIPDSVTTVGGYAFGGCDSLNAVYISDLSAWCRIDFSNKESNPLTFAHNLYLNNELVTDLTIPSDITVIKDFSFFSGNSILNINLHNGITSVGFAAFVGCSIQGITIPDSITEIKDAAFTQCHHLLEFRGKFATEDGLALIVDGRFHAFANGSGITEYTIPEGVATIGASAFNQAYSLESVTIPSSVNQIGDNAFWHTPNLKKVYCKSTIPPYLGRYIFGDYNNINASYCKIYVPAESYQDYISAEGWSQYAASILPYDYDNNYVIEANASEETKRWLGKWSSTVSRTYCPQTGFNEETVTFDVNIEHNAVAPNLVKVYGLSVIDPTIAVDGFVNANGDLEILNFNYIGNSGEWELYVWALSEAMSLSPDRHAVYTMSMDESGNVSCEVSSFEGSPYIMFDILAYNVNTGNVGWLDASLSYYSGPMSWVKVADSGATPSRNSQKISYRHNLRPQANAKLKVVE